MSTMNDPTMEADRFMTLREQLHGLLRNSWLPHLALVLCAACSMLLPSHSYAPDAIATMAGLLALVATLRIISVRYYDQHAPTLKNYWQWRVLQLAGALVTGVLAMTLIALLLPHAQGWQQMLVLGMLVSLTAAFWLASVGCLLSFVCYSLPMTVGAGVIVFTSDNPGLQNLALFFIGLITLELMATLRVSSLHTSKMMLTQLLLQVRAQRDEEVAEQQKELARLKTRVHSLQLQTGSLQAHLEHNSSEQTRNLKHSLEQLRTREERLQRALDASSLSLWDWDLISGRVYHTGTEKLLGISTGQASDALADLRPLTHPDDQEVVREAMTAHLRGERDDYRVEFRIRHADGHWVWIEDSGQAISRDSEGRVLRMLGTRRDISERRQHERDLQLASILFDTSSEAIIVMDPNLRVLTVNQAFTQTTGFERHNAQIFKEHLHQALKTHNLDAIRQTLLDKGDWHGEASGIHHSGKSFPLRLQLKLLRSSTDQKISYVVGFFADLTQFRETQKKLDYLARHDELTGLANRNLFHQHLHKASLEKQQADSSLALLHIDLDRFKLLNECYGTQTGDEVLRIVGRRLGRFTSAQCNLARLSGNEFAMLVTGSPRLEDLEQLTEEVLSSLRTPFAIAGEELLLSASIGVSVLSGTEQDAHTLLNQAAIALDHAKFLGGNRWQLYQDEIAPDGGDRLQLEQQLRRGLLEGHVVAHYQPKLDLQSNRIYGVEALARWFHPERGTISPMEFIPLAEETGLIGPLGEIILRQACAQGKAWLDAGAALVVSVNLSVQHLRQGNILQLVRDVLEETGLPAHLLELELTESQLLENSGQLFQTLADVQAMGVKIAVDDFGTGYSSLSYLKQLPVDCLKIDRTFIRDLPGDSQDQAITQAIINMAHGLQLQVVAEGVETHEQLDALRSMNCDAVQGYLVARPSPAEDIAPYLQREIELVS